jgi:hypothetical protein
VAGKDLDVRVDRAREAEGRSGDAASLAFRFGGMVELEDAGKSRLGKSRFGVTNYDSGLKEMVVGRSTTEHINLL